MQVNKETKLNTADRLLFSLFNQNEYGYGSNTPRNIICVATYLPSQKPSEQDMRDSAGEARTNS